MSANPPYFNPYPPESPRHRGFRRMYYRPTPQEIAACKRMAKRGDTLEQIAQVTGWDTSLVRTILASK
jgi:hypothetical protein